ncbi:MAG: nodulation protein NfeD [Methanobacteriaceae archaeon]|jgi:membrane-bound serine protease (ClpP class)
MSKIFRILLIIFFIISPSVALAESTVLVLEISDPITPASGDLVADAITVAERDGHEALVIKLNTPGGALDETFNIVNSIAATNIPVIGFVYPKGATAWSAGTMILISTDIAAMGPHTIIGSMQPVVMTPEGPKPIDDPKIIHALVEFTRERAAMYDRNATLAEKFITENLNINDTKALKYDVIEFRADNVSDLLTQIDGIEIDGVKLNTKDATIINYEMPFSLSIMMILSHPIVSSLLIMLGIYGIIFGIGEPGAGAELFGIIAIVLGIVGMGFEVNIAAIFLLILGFILIAIEFRTPEFGIFGIAGLIALTLGGILLPLHQWDAYDPEFVWTMILAISAPSIIIGIFILFIIYKVMEARRKKPMMGSMIGDFAETIDKISSDAKGFVKYKGEYWRAKSDVSIGVGKKVEIIKKEGPVLIVKEVKENNDLS